MTQPDLLTHQGYAVAEPAARILTWFEGDLGDPAIASPVVNAFRAFDALYRRDTALLRITEKGHRTRKPDDTSVAGAVEWLENAPKSFGKGLFVNGSKDGPLSCHSIPSFRVNQGNGMVQLEISVKPDLARALDLFFAVEEALRDAPILTGVMGYGFHQPLEKSSLIWHLPLAFARYRAAIEIQIDTSKDGMRPIGNPVLRRKFPEFEPGIPDIGWKTFVGPSFVHRVPNLPDHPGLRIEKAGSGLVATVGQAPIWGDVNAQEDIAGYRALASWLKPLRLHRPLAYGQMFGSQSQSPEGRDRIDAYLDRFDDPMAADPEAGGIFDL